ncbi:MAG: DUF296 domain-containing protein [Candidatus ainarchaeum sp.]|nr:DUF296 domain-containing protein [Candidatus ainarchaeum sp.]MDD3975938.1 DUF296 domain-containing protein [Candidatus ainarchaeum sp.]
MIKSKMQDVKEKNDNYLTIILDDGDEVIKSIETAFKENQIKKAILISAEGNIKDTRIAISRAGNLRQRIYSESLRIKQVSGEFNKVNDDYYGDVNISIEKDPIHIISGVLLKAHADKEVIIKLKIINNINFGINSKDHKENISAIKQKILDETQKKPKPMIIA